MTAAYVRVLNTNPLITISKRARWLDQPLGYAPFIRNLDSHGRSLHLVGLCFSAEPDGGQGPDSGLFDNPEWLARDYARVSAEHPRALFVILTNTDAETLALSRRGIPCFQANEHIFIDDSQYQVVEWQGERRYKAVYNAIFIPFKRHGLASQIEDLLLIFMQPGPEQLSRVRALLPNAHYRNFDEGQGWRLLSPKDIALDYANCGAGLCLSSVEGSMRASIEYLLCGLPVISTPSRGGRDRYFQDGHAFIVEAEPGAVAETARHVHSLNLPREPIRRAAIEKLNFERANFLRAANAVVGAEFGLHALFKDIQPFLNVVAPSSPAGTPGVERGPVAVSTV